MNDSQLPGFEMVSADMLQTIKAVNNGLIGTFIGTGGIIANIINIIVFLKEGSNDNVNISLLALSISDLCSLITQEWINLLWTPFFVAGLPFIPDEVLHLSEGWPHGMFVKITNLITVFVTFERCLCVFKPLKVKTILTRTRTVMIMIMIHILMFLTIVPEISTAYIGWKFFPETNTSLVGMVERANRGFLGQLSFTFSGAVQQFSFVAVCVLTTLLIFKVKEKSKWRLSSAGDSSKESTRQKRDNRTVKMITNVAIIFIICLLLSVVNCTITTIVAEYRTMGRYHNAFFTGWSFTFLTETINASVNIFVYYNMSTKYKQTFQSIFRCCFQLETKKDLE